MKGKMNAVSEIREWVVKLEGEIIVDGKDIDYRYDLIPERILGSPITMRGILDPQKDYVIGVITKVEVDE